MVQYLDMLINSETQRAVFIEAEEAAKDIDKSLINIKANIKA